MGDKDNRSEDQFRYDRIGIDLGGTKIEGILLAGDIRGRIRVATPAGDYAATLSAICDLIEQLRRNFGTGRESRIGLGMPGSLSPETGLARNANSVCLNGKPLKQDLEMRLGQPIRIANDANCFVLSEAVDGAAEGAETVFGVIMGTGVGAGIVVHGQCLNGHNGIAGEWGHTSWPFYSMPDVQFPDPVPQCFCGKQGCIETFLSGPGLLNIYRFYNGKAERVEEVVAAAAAGDYGAGLTLDRHARYTAAALAGIVNVLDPDVIVMGGGVSGIPGLVERLPELMRPLVFSDSFTTRITLPRHGAASGVRGAARLWPAD